MTTARDIVTLAAKEAGILGVGQTLGAEDVNDCFTLLTNMLAQWQKQRWLVPSLQDLSFQATGATSYSFGVGGTFNTYRPDKIQAAYARQTVGVQNIDYALERINSYEDYSRLSLKSLASFPNYFFYDNQFPLGRLFVWPLPSSLYQLHVIVKSELAPFTTLDSTFIMPPEYLDAIHYNLAIKIWSMYDLPPKPTTVALARSALNVIRVANTQIGEMRMPRELTRRGSRYNVYSDTST